MPYNYELHDATLRMKRYWEEAEAIRRIKEVREDNRPLFSERVAMMKGKKFQSEPDVDVVKSGREDEPLGVDLVRIIKPRKGGS